jgi:hypothetical protein
LLGSLSTVSSIVVGFGLAAIVSIATAEKDRADDIFCQITAGCWTLSSLLLLAVLLSAEILRRSEVGSRIAISDAEEDKIWSRCVRLLWMFSISLLLTATGVVLLAFHISWNHGIWALAGLVFAFASILRVFR